MHLPKSAVKIYVATVKSMHVTTEIQSMIVVNLDHFVSKRFLTLHKVENI